MDIKKVILISISFIIAIHGLTQAADITLSTSKHVGLIGIKGNIEGGDFIKLSQILDQAVQSGIVVVQVGLASQGGDVVEAMKIGQLIRDYMIWTRAPELMDGQFLCPWFDSDKVDEWFSDQCQCASSCFLIWAAGVQRSGSVLGLHRPYFSKEYFKGLSGEQAQKKYEEMSLTVQKYVQKMEIPSFLIEKMFSVGSEDIYYPPPEMLENLQKVSFFDEWISSNCGSISKEEDDKYNELLTLKAKHSELSKVDEILLETLHKRWSEHGVCRLKKIREHQQGKQ